MGNSPLVVVRFVNGSPPWKGGGSNPRCAVPQSVQEEYLAFLRRHNLETEERYLCE
jgi:hypothetical protein